MLSICMSSRAARLRLSSSLRLTSSGYLRSYASNYKKRTGGSSINQSKKSNDLLKTPSIPEASAISNQIPVKIVQVRSSSSSGLSNSGASVLNSSPNELHTNKFKPTQSELLTLSTRPYGSSGKPPNNSNNLRNILIGLAVAATSLGGMYYSGFFDSSTSDKKESKLTDKKKKSRPINRYPASREDFPTKIPYVLIGGGTASFAAFRAIKSKDPTAKVLVISAEDSLPYMRPPLSKEIWQRKDLPDMENLSFKQWNGQERSLYYEPLDFYTKIDELDNSSHGGVVVATGWNVSRVDAPSNTVYVIDPKTNLEFPLEYNKCLIATGSKPKNLPVFTKVWDSISSRTILYRNVRDFENLWDQIQNAKSIAIVGGGFLGSELACSLGRRFKDDPDKKVFQIFKEPGNMGRVLPEYLSKWTTHKVVGEGVEVITEAEVKDVKMVNDQVRLSLSNESVVRADVVIVAVGSEPRTELAEISQLEIEPQNGGFLVNAELEARSNLYVAGDAACFYDPVLGRRRIEHHDHAVVSGRLAGENMAGSAKHYKHQSMFWSDLGPDVGYEAIGIIDAELPTVSVFTKDLKSEKSVEQKSNENNNVENVDKVSADNSHNSSIEATEKSSEIVKQDDKNEVQSKEDYNKGIIFYMKNETVVGIVLWNVFNRMHIARQVLSQRAKYDDLNELAKLFNLHDE